MNKLTVILACFLIGQQVSSAFAQTAAAKPDLASADWSAAQAERLNGVPKKEIWSFMNGGDPGADSPGSGKVCEFQFVDLHHSGTLSLVIAYDNGGRAECNDVEIIDKAPTGFRYYDFDATQDFGFASVQDLKHNGHLELVVRGGVAGGGPGHCIATWPIIYAWNGTGYSDVGRDYKNYYEQYLASLQNEIASVEQSEVTRTERHKGQAVRESTGPVNDLTTTGSNTGVEQGGTDGGASMPSNNNSDRLPSPMPPAPPSPESALLDSAELDCTKAEAAKIQRYLDISRDAGMGDAVKWAESDDPATRRFAAVILSQIGTREATEYLRTLSHDPDPNVATSGKESLTAVHAPHRDVHPTIQGQPLTQYNGKISAK
jgi:hypothetical protein